MTPSSHPPASVEPVPVERGMSIIIPVKDRVPEMRRQLEALSAAIATCTEPTEIIVVDDSAPEQARAHRANCAAFGASYVRGPRHVGAKRNVGARHAAYDLLMFTDSDCRVPADLLERYAVRLRGSGPQVAAVTGPVIVERGDNAVFRVMKRSYLLLGDLQRPLYYDRVTWGAGANTAVKRAAFEAVGGFPEDSPMPIGGEDLHFGLTLTDAGYAIVCEPQGRVTHDTAVAETVGAVYYRLTTYARSEVWLCIRHPHRRRFVFNAASTLAVTALAGAATSGRTRRRSLWAVPSVAGVLIGAKVPGLLAGDRSARAVGEALACAAAELIFDGAAFVAALRMRRPDLLFTGFRAPDEEMYRSVPAMAGAPAPPVLTIDEDAPVAR